MKEINKILLLVGLGAMMCASNYSFASVEAVIQNTNPTDVGPGQWPTPRFKDAKNANDLVCNDANYDKLTGLMWVKDGNASGAINSSEAKTYPNNLTLCGYNDWRLPTINELRSLINYEDTISVSSWLNSHGFNGIQSASYWSSTNYSLSGGYAWSVFMPDGYVYYSNLSDNHFVLPVRGPNR